MAEMKLSYQTASVQASYNRYRSTTASTATTVSYEQTMTEKSKGGLSEGILGMTFLNNPSSNIAYGMTAKYAENSTENNPVIRLTINKGNGNFEEYDVNINEIDPKNASEMEMFALCSYADDIGMGTGGTFGSWQTLKYYKINAEHNGYFNSQSLKQDWASMVTNMMNDYLRGGIYKQALDGKKLLYMFSNGINGGEYPDKTMTDEEWDSFLGNVDKAIDTYKEEVRQEAAERTENAEKAKKTDNRAELGVKSTESTVEITSQFSQEKTWYITCYTKEGIFCSSSAQGSNDGYLWQIKFDSSDQYDKVMDFINKFSEDENLVFASKEEFWKDFLAGKIDADDFYEFYENTDSGVTDYSKVVGDSLTVDKEKAKYFKYVSNTSARFYTEEEMFEMQRQLMEANLSARPKETYGQMYKRLHPEYNGEPIFCEYPGGPLYTADEMAEKMMKNLELEKMRKNAR